MSGRRLAPGLEVVTIPDGVAVVNGGPPVLFLGRAATEVFIPLLAALDSGLNVLELADRTGLALAHVERGLSLLDERALLEAD